MCLRLSDTLKETRDASNFAAACAQLNVAPFIPDFAFDMKNQSEDCLYLNVFSPQGSTTQSLPVMLFIHGGSFIMGGPSQYQYYPDSLVAAGFVVVTISYRLGPFGFLALQALGNEGPTGNYGLQDQTAAMQWVRENIHNFGGDAEQVTLFGESAGALSCCLHLIDPQSFGLYSKMILESGPCTQINLFPALDVATSQGDKLASAVSCSECKRLSVSVSSLH